MPMDHTDAHQDNNTSQTHSLVEQLRRDSEDASDTWTDRFRKLAQAIEEASDIELSCEECHSLFDIYIHQELEDRTASERYPAVWNHLESCDACHNDFEIIINTLLEERRTPLTHTPEAHEKLHALPFLRDKPVVEKWLTRVRSRLAGALPGFSIQLNPDFLRGELFPSSNSLQPVLRSSTFAPVETDRHLLLIDLVSFEERLINVQIESEHDPDSENISLHITLASDSALPHNLWMELIWAGHNRIKPVTLTDDEEEGQVTIDNLSLAELKDAKDELTRFEVRFEVRSA